MIFLVTDTQRANSLKQNYHQPTGVTLAPLTVLLCCSLMQQDSIQARLQMNVKMAGTLQRSGKRAPEFLCYLLVR